MEPLQRLQQFLVDAQVDGQLQMRILGLPVAPLQQRATVVLQDEEEGVAADAKVQQLADPRDPGQRVQHVDLVKDIHMVAVVVDAVWHVHHLNRHRRRGAAAKRGQVAAVHGAVGAAGDALRGGVQVCGEEGSRQQAEEHHRGWALLVGGLQQARQQPRVFRVVKVVVEQNGDVLFVKLVRHLGAVQLGELPIRPEQQLHHHLYNKEVELGIQVEAPQHAAVRVD
mmetsp:Transcript_8843/g.25498  ORF Transcript_8843/g.25498 Transcript_8843/m.25498 type:complete len:225 (+) Transcript_8843:2073-2747(+)